MTDMGEKYDNIRPYTDAEMVAALDRVAAHPLLTNILNFIAPGSERADFEALLRSLRTVDDFQVKVMATVMNRLLEGTTTGLTCSGIENTLRPEKSLLLGNHRDIVLDPGIMQLIFYRNQVPRTEIAVGDNLISSQFVEDIMRSNRMIKVIRKGTPRELYVNSTLLSNYIRESVANGRASIWLAQRSGRTKDGSDQTSQGLLKMLDMSGSGNFVDDFNALAILPVSVSYEFEPCDFLKARETFISRRREYVKAPGEDMNSILTGILQQKGRVHFHFGEPLTREELEVCGQMDKNERFRGLAALLDRKINANYRLWPNNYIAFDVLAETPEYADQYTQAEKDCFLGYVEAGLDALFAKESEETRAELDRAELRELVLALYANPVHSHRNL